MASIAEEKRGDRALYRLTFVDETGKRRFVRLSGLTKRAAETAAGHVEHIVAAKAGGTALPKATAEWIASRPQQLHDKLAKVGLFERRRFVTLKQFTTDFIDSRREGHRPRTIINWEQAAAKLIDFFGDCDLREITPQRAQAWRLSLAEKHAQATVACHVKRARQMFREAAAQKFVAADPFAEVVAGKDDNSARQYHVTVEQAERLIDACPNADWRVMIALARYAGLRCPSEVPSLKWSDIDWERNRMRVESIKTRRQGKPFREVPIFGRLYPYLEDAAAVAPDGAVYVVERYRGGEKNLRTRLLAYIKKAGLTPWPRLWHNLRASCATDLADEFPSHVAAQWLGHSEAVAAKNYRMATSEHFARATQVGGGAQSGTEGVEIGLKPTATSELAFSGSSGDAAISVHYATGEVPRRGVEPLSPP